VSKIKSKYFEFICSQDYADYYLNADEQTRLERIRKASEQLSEPQQYLSSQELRKRLKARFKRGASA
jgi:hypothetical protein